jgi:hypothetical protein
MRLRTTRPDLAALLEVLLLGAMLPKPAEHTGGPETDFLFLDLSNNEVEEITEAVGNLEVAVAMDTSPPSRELAREFAAIAALHDQWLRAESSRSDAA